MMDKKPEMERTQETHQYVNEELEITEEILKKRKEEEEKEEEELRKKGYTEFEINLKLSGFEKLGITEEILRKWDEEDEQWRKEGLSVHEMVERHFGPLVDKIDNDIHWE